eukprot:TRINITY_DN4552_c0_g3_i2.p1 TRINITY_DN4552_c0_g3~~TRINITY_DN4552_c0_g3_i2.p1  ORF type:complete len:574 (-),score=116.70 TRINITY_DN4552_c0_g3_i2:145-1866(-)
MAREPHRVPGHFPPPEDPLSHWDSFWPALPAPQPSPFPTFIPSSSLRSKTISQVPERFHSATASHDSPPHGRNRQGDTSAGSDFTAAHNANSWDSRESPREWARSEPRRQEEQILPPETGHGPGGDSGQGSSQLGFPNEGLRWSGGCFTKPDEWPAPLRMPRGTARVAWTQGEGTAVSAGEGSRIPGSGLDEADRWPAPPWMPAAWTTVAGTRGGTAMSGGEESTPSQIGRSSTADEVLEGAVGPGGAEGVLPDAAAAVVRQRAAVEAVKSVVDQRGKIVCLSCSKALRTQESLQQHLASKHQGYNSVARRLLEAQQQVSGAPSPLPSTRASQKGANRRTLSIADVMVLQRANPSAQQYPSPIAHNVPSHKPTPSFSRDGHGRNSGREEAHGPLPRSTAAAGSAAQPAGPTAPQRYPAPPFGGLGGGRAGGRAAYQPVLLHNPASSTVVHRRGKEKLVPKKKKPSSLKKVILRERAARNGEGNDANVVEREEGPGGEVPADEKEQEGGGGSGNATILPNAIGDNGAASAGDTENADTEHIGGCGRGRGKGGGGGRGGDDEKRGRRQFKYWEED